MNDPIVPRDSIDLLVTAVIMAGFSAAGDISPSTAREAVQHADTLGEMLWRENFAAAAHLNDAGPSMPVYEWRPVLELIGTDTTPEQLLQIERTRRCLERNSQDQPGGTTSRARRLHETLAAAIDQGLHGWPKALQVDELGQEDFAGIDQAVDHWTRSIGFLSISRAPKRHA